ncbi:uncharacterized protein LOC109827369 isoform X2 [Asparagus officinalis]|uniref:uncharacterized protein LOC109827369 isoform X2 n=1 Tax=Asparagus officinalis TaxID=4686 RepID=UPI00098E6113|nr:uncharacterized protein LOC109827369 isoform X2 [Asparagus officinalis]
MLSFKFNIRGWTHRVSRASGNSFLAQFPDVNMIEQAEDMKLVDIEDFKSRFLRWREDFGLKVLPKPVLTLVRISHLPYYLWDWEFLLILFKDVGECITCSDDVAFSTHFSSCKVLIEVRDVFIIPREIRFRCHSPFDNSLLEGYATLEVIGKPVKGKDFHDRVEIREHELKWEGERSSFSGWVDRVLEVEVVQPPIDHGKRQSVAEEEDRNKGKFVISKISYSTGTVSKASSMESSDSLGNPRNKIMSLPPISSHQAVHSSPDLLRYFGTTILLWWSVISGKDLFVLKVWKEEVDWVSEAS